jgi:hypothetical protein
MQSDKELIRQGKYQEALGDNFNYKPIYVMLYKDGECIDQLKERFTTKPEAIEWLKENKPPLNDGEGYMYGNINADWL